MSSLIEHHFVGDLITTFTFDIVVIENTKQNSTTQIPRKNENKISQIDVPLEHYRIMQLVRTKITKPKVK